MLELKTYKNYRELCKAMNWKVTSSDSKAKQFKELDSLCKWHKQGNKIIIDEIYSEPKEIIDNRKGNGSNALYLPYTLPLLEEYILQMSKGGNSITTSIYGIVDYMFKVNSKHINDCIFKYKKSVVKDIINEDLLSKWSKEVENIIKSTLRGVVEDRTLKLLQGEKYPQFNIVADTLNIMTNKKDPHHYYNDKMLVERYKIHQKEYAHSCHLKDDNMFYATDKQWKTCNMLFLHIPENREILENKMHNLYEELEEEGVELVRIQTNYTITKIEDSSKTKETNSEEVKIQKEEKKETIKLLKILVYDKIGEKIQKGDIFKKYELGYKVKLAEDILNYIFKLNVDAETDLDRLNKKIEELEEENRILREKLSKQNAKIVSKSEEIRKLREEIERLKNNK